MRSRLFAVGSFVYKFWNICGQSRNIHSQYFTNKKVGLRSNSSAFPVHGPASLILMSKYVRSRNFFGVSY